MVKLLQYMSHLLHKMRSFIFAALCLWQFSFAQERDIDERVTYLENKVAGLSSRVLSLEYVIKDMQHQASSTKNKVVPHHHQHQPVQSQSHTVEITPPEAISASNVDDGGFRPRDCSQIKEELDPRQRHSTYYTIYPISRTRPVEVFCDMETLGGGWTVIQKRGFEGMVREDFNKTWKEYQKGFGVMGGDFWLGLDNIASLTKYDDQEILYEFLNLKDDGQRVVEQVNYDRFKVDPASEFYRLHLAAFKVTSGNPPQYYLEKQDGILFSTRDKDNAGTNNKNCRHASGWWFLSTICHRQPDLNMPFDNDILHIHKFNIVQARYGVSMKIRARPGSVAKE